QPAHQWPRGSRVWQLPHRRLPGLCIPLTACPPHTSSPDLLTKLIGSCSWLLSIESHKYDLHRIIWLNISLDRNRSRGYSPRVQSAHIKLNMARGTFQPDEENGVRQIVPRPNIGFRRGRR